MSDWDFPRNPDGSLRTRKSEENMPGGRGEVYKALHWLNDGMEAGMDGLEDGARWVGNTASDAWDGATDVASDAWDGTKDAASDAYEWATGWL